MKKLKVMSLFRSVPGQLHPRNLPALYPRHKFHTFFRMLFQRTIHRVGMEQRLTLAMLQQDIESYLS